MEELVQCPFCFQEFSIEIHVEDGQTQDLLQDCEVCCHPLELHAHWSDDDSRFTVQVGKSSGFD